MISPQHISSAISYEQYVKRVKELLEKGQSTGLIQTPEYLDYSKINLQRMQRLDKTIKIIPELETALQNIRGEYYLVAISEGWCGDAAQNVPLFEIISQHSKAFQLKILMRDEHPELMDQYLTNGSRSIPKLICVDKDSLNERFVWGPRPAELQQKVIAALAAGSTKEEKGLMVQQWYNNDKTVSAQKEFCDLVRDL